MCSDVQYLQLRTCEPHTQPGRGSQRRMSRIDITLEGLMIIQNLKHHFEKEKIYNLLLKSQDDNHHLVHILC